MQLSCSKSAVPLQKIAKIWHIYMNIVARGATNITIMITTTKVTIITITKPMSLTNIIMTTKVTSTLMSITTTSTP